VYACVLVVQVRVKKKRATAVRIGARIADVSVLVSQQYSRWQPNTDSIRDLRVNTTGQRVAVMYVGLYPAQYRTNTLILIRGGNYPNTGLKTPHGGTA